jgi:serine protease
VKPARAALLASLAALAMSPAVALDGVIVTFRAGASVERAQTLSAGAPARDVAAVLQSRAAWLGARHALALRAGAAVGARTQVLHADPAAGLDAATLAARLRRDPDVEAAEPDARARRLAVPNDPLFATGHPTLGPTVGQWYLRAPAGEAVSAIDAVRAWDTTMGSASVLVAVLDTGVRFDHPDLASKFVAGYDMVSDAAIANDSDGRDADASDPGDWVTAAEAATPAFSGCDVSNSSWHGTQVSGIVAAATNNAQGMAGAGWDVRVLPVRVLGKCNGLISDIAAGIRWAAGVSVPGVPANPSPARVVNLSLGSEGACSTALQQAIDEARARGVVVVVAAGNTAGKAANSPSNCAGVIGVAALRHIGTKVGFSDVGPELSIGAPGGNCVDIGPGDACRYPILTTIDLGTQGPTGPGYSDSFRISVGTSFSAPLVSATAALMLSAQPALTPEGVRDVMRATARAFPASGAADDPQLGPIQTCVAPSAAEQLQCYCTTTTCGAGMLDAGAAVQASLGPVAAFSVAPAAPQVGQTVTFDSQASGASSGRTIVARQWTLVAGNGVVTGFVGATDGLTASVVPVAAGSFTLRLTVTDSTGAAVTADQTVSVVSAPAAVVTGDGGGGGGGVMAGGWLAALVLATALLAFHSRRTAALTS